MPLWLRKISVLLACLFAAACTTAEGGPDIGKPFSYARDRCVGSYNQCSADCSGIEDGPARAACSQQCLTVEDRCYLTGDNGSSLAVESAIAAARTEEEKEADFQRWKAARERERAAAGKKADGPQ